MEDCIDGFRQRVSRVPADTVDWSHLQAWRCVITFCCATQRLHDGDSSRAFALLSSIDSFLAVGSAGGESWCRIYRVVSQMLIGQHYRRLNKSHAACEAYCKAAKLCKSSSNAILQLLAPCALSESGAALLSIGRAAEAQAALELAISQLSQLLERCIHWREVVQSVCKQAGHYWAIDGDCWGALFSEAVGIQTVASFFNLSLAYAKQSSVKNCCKCMKQCFAVGKLSLSPAHPILHAVARPCEAAQQVLSSALHALAQFWLGIYDSCLQRQYWRATNSNGGETTGGSASVRPRTATSNQGRPSTAGEVGSKPWCPASMSPQKAHKVTYIAQGGGPRGVEEKTSPPFWSAAKR